LDYGRRGGSVSFKSGNTVNIKKELGVSVVTAIQGEISRSITNINTNLIGLGDLL
jgi:hypothetical protein